MSTEHSGPRAAQRPADPQALLVTADESLYGDVALIAAIARIPLERRSTWDEVPEDDFVILMCGPDALPPESRAGNIVLLVGRSASGASTGTDGDDVVPSDLWSLAAHRSDVWPVPLPEAEVWLSELIGTRASTSATGRTIAVAGAVGGAGASTVAYLLAAELAARAYSVALVDADPQCGSGLSGLLDGSASTSSAQRWLGWEDVLALGEDIAGAQLSASLPRVDGVYLLTGRQLRPFVTGGAESPWTRAVGASVRAAGRVFDVVVVDVARQPGVLNPLSAMTDRLLLVTPGTERGVVAGRALLDAAAESSPALVVNRSSASGWDPAEVSRALHGAEVLAEIPRLRRLSGSRSIAEAYDVLHARRGARIMDGVVAGLGLAPVGAGVGA